MALIHGHLTSEVERLTASVRDLDERLDACPSRASLEQPPEKP